MTANPIRRLLQAKPFVSFALYIGFEREIVIDDPERCRLDEDELLLYVSYPERRPPERFRQVPIEPATIEIVDLRLVSSVSVRSEKLPG